VNNIHFFATTERKFLNRNCHDFRTRAVSCVEKYFKKLLWERSMIYPALQKYLMHKKMLPCQEHFFANHNEWPRSLITVQHVIQCVSL